MNKIDKKEMAKKIEILAGKRKEVISAIILMQSALHEFNGEIKQLHHQIQPIENHVSLKDMKISEIVKN